MVVPSDVSEHQLDYSGKNALISTGNLQIFIIVSTAFFKIWGVVLFVVWKRSNLFIINNVQYQYRYNVHELRQTILFEA